MAVKHKVVECVEPQAEARLTIILRALQSISAEHDLQGVELAKLCESIVFSLGTVKMPTKTEDYVNFMADIKNVQEILVQACSSEDVIFATLKALYNGISDPSKQRQPTMSIVLQLIDVEAIPSAVKWILQSGYSDKSLEEALRTLCDWLSRWTWTPNLGPLVLSFMQGLEVEQHFEILVDVTLKYVERLFVLLIVPEPRKTVGPVVLHMLSSMQHNPDAFHKVIPLTRRVLFSLHKENSDSSLLYSQQIVNLCVALMEHFPGYKTLYDDLMCAIEPFSPTLNIKQRLSCKSWVNGSTLAIPPLDMSRKVGLNNLGNTCYMNSVLQALFMTKLFRNDILLTDGEMMPLFSKLQILFALLQHSHRTSLSPSDILNLARPPGFQPGHQHDSSEFLGYLLDVLHEQEKSMYVSARSNGGNSSQDVSPQTTTVIQRSFGGRAVTISRCGNCDTQSERADYFRELQLSFPSNCGNQSVQTLLDYYLQPEKLCGDNQYHCDTCHGLTDGERVTRVVEPPSRLVLTLKHFRYDPASQQRTKLLQHVKLDSFVHLDNANYELYAAVVHVGSSLDSGHYYTYARDGQDWYKFNDCLVTRTTAEELCSVRPPETPYILFYSKHDYLDPDPLPRSALSSTLESILVRDNSEVDTERRRRPLKTYENRNKRNDEPPPPGCGGGSFLNNANGSRFVC
ncbi:hypothetical protein ILUMI_08104 [Ignelater luminosus]|uniref:USP domain-containing protein n=1 Tax=Ignelater luminosus TaxID=2038154 RepID=A0A8K0D686_IGNLU|nr:hypothetical protein ILUMI_08104 [Ignelater luminosus]